MLHWLHKKSLFHDPLVRVSIGVACGLHVVFFLGCVVMHYLRPVTRIAINKDALSGSQVTIVIDPTLKPGLYASAHKASSVVVASHGAQIPKKEIPPQQTTVVTEKKQTPKKIQKPAAKKPAVKKTVPSKPSSSAKPGAAKASLGKSSGGQEKIAPKKVEKKPAPKKKTAPPPADTLKKNEPQPVAQPVTPETPVAQTALPASAQLPAQIDGPILIARSATEAAALTVHLAVQEELLRVWHPPVGVDAALSCQIRVTLDAQGNPQNIELIKPSGMLLFDTSARAAVQQAAWPPAVWGTTIELCLQ